jgi:hypothetical protein
MASSYSVAGTTDHDHDYGQYEQSFRWQHTENLYDVMWSSMAEKRNENSKLKFLQIITYCFVHFVARVTVCIFLVSMYYINDAFSAGY